jgi:hypothetical protein
MFLSKIILTPSDIIASIALIASAIGLIFSYITMRQQRQHNIKSVMPILHVGLWDYEDCLTVTVKNCGLGVAIVKKMTATQANNTEVKGNIYAWLPQKLDANVNYSHYWTPDTDFVVQPGETINLVRIPIDDTKSEQIAVREILRAQIGSLTLYMEYRDIYNNIMPIKKRELSYFLRKDNVNKAIVLSK